MSADRSSNAEENLQFISRSRILLLKGHRKTLKECFVQNVGANEATIIRSLTLGVGSSDDVESCGRSHHLTNLFQEDTFTFEDRLKAKNLVGSSGQSRQTVESPRSSLTTGPLCQTVSPLTRRNPPMRSSSSVSI